MIRSKLELLKGSKSAKKLISKLIKKLLEDSKLAESEGKSTKGSKLAEKLVQKSRYPY